MLSNQSRTHVCLGNRLFFSVQKNSYMYIFLYVNEEVQRKSTVNSEHPWITLKK